MSLIAAAGTVYLVTLGATTLDATRRGAGISADIGDHTALGIFLRFHVTYFDVFCLFLVLHVCYLSLAVYLAILGATTLDAMGRGAGISVDIGDHTALGVFFGFQVTNVDLCLFLVSHVCYLSFVGLLIDCVVSLAPKSNCCPPVTSCFGIRSSRRINFAFLRLGL